MKMINFSNKVKRLGIILSLAFSFNLNALASQWQSPLLPITDKFTLSNGLRVLIEEDHTAPVASVVIIYDVGARNEVKGRSGFAHLFEHMMFEGSQNVGKTEHFKYIESVGGVLNASTHSDFTNYYEMLPSNQIELALWLESDRMKSLKVTDENFHNQLETVKEEKRLRIDNQPYIPAALKLEELTFDNWSNSHAVIGSFEDLESSSTKDVKDFFNMYYAPNNAVMVITGDVDAKKLKPVIEKYFATIPAGPKPPAPNVVEPEQKQPKVVTLDDSHAKSKAVWMAFKAPGRREDEYYALGLIEKILSGGDSSRLYQRMVKGDKIALSVNAEYDERRGPAAFETFAILKPGVNFDKAKDVIMDEIKKLQTVPVSEKELETAKNQILKTVFDSSSSFTLERSLGRAETICEYECFYDNPALFEEDLNKYMKVTALDIQKACKNLLTNAKSTTVNVNPVEAVDRVDTHDKDGAKSSPKSTQG